MIKLLVDSLSPCSRIKLGLTLIGESPTKRASNVLVLKRVINNNKFILFILTNFKRLEIRNHV